MSRSPILLAITWLITCLATLTAGLAIRLAPVELTVAWPSLVPWTNAVNLTSVLALVLAVLAGLSLLILSSIAREGNRARPFAELLLFFPLFFAFVWFLWPTGKPNTQSIIIGAGLLAAALYFLSNSPGPISSNRWKWRTSSILLDLCLVVVPIILGIALGVSPDLKASGLSIFLYPVYALIQLLLFLFIPVTRLRAMGISHKSSSFFAALVFALIHWPNPLVMLVTFGGMLIWAHQFQNGRQLWQLALVMGLTATTFSQFLPDDLTRHARVGPGFVRSEAVALMGDNSDIRNPADYISFSYPQTIGRKVLPEELVKWTTLINKAQCSTWAFMFLTSSENINRLVKAQEEVPPTEVTHWSEWPEEWKTRISYFTSDEYWEKSGKTQMGYLDTLYLDILGRRETPEGLKLWPTTLSVRQRQRIAEVLLDFRLQNGQDIFTGMSAEALRLPN